jgi:sugar lactone lactonase YvrE
MMKENELIGKAIDMTFNTEKKQTARLDDWSISPDGVIVMGTVTGHSKIPDGEYIRTSTVVRLDFSQSQLETLNTIYQLGAAH